MSVSFARRHVCDAKTKHAWLSCDITTKVAVIFFNYSLSRWYGYMSHRFIDQNKSYILMPTLNHKLMPTFNHKWHSCLSFNRCHHRHVSACLPSLTFWKLMSFWKFKNNWHMTECQVLELNMDLWCRTCLIKWMRKHYFISVFCYKWPWKCNVSGGCPLRFSFRSRLIEDGWSGLRDMERITLDTKGVMGRLYNKGVHRLIDISNLWYANLT